MENDTLCNKHIQELGYHGVMPNALENSPIGKRLLSKHRIIDKWRKGSVNCEICKTVARNFRVVLYLLLFDGTPYCVILLS